MSLAPSRPAEPVCSFCRCVFAADEAQVVHFTDGRVAGTYHEWCRPDRRRSGCGASGCRV